MLVFNMRHYTCRLNKTICSVSFLIKPAEMNMSEIIIDNTYKRTANPMYNLLVVYTTNKLLKKYWLQVFKLAFANAM